MNATRVLLIVLGALVIARLVTKDSAGETLAGRIAGGQPPPFGASSASTAASTSTSSGGGASTTSSTGSAKPVAVGPTGAGETAFAHSFLKSIGAPLNAVDMSALQDWWAQEEGSSVLVPGHGGTNNPFEVTTSGDANVPSTGNANSVGVKNYATPQQGVQAAIGYFNKYGPSVLQEFRSGKSISAIEGAVRNLGPNAFGSDTASPWAVR